MSVLPYSFGPVICNAPGGVLTAVELRVPHRGEINAIRLHQVAGTFVAGSFRILTKLEAAQDLDGSSQSAALTGIDPDSYSVFGRKSFGVTGFEEYGKNYQYRNKDGTYSVPVRRLYLILEPTGSGAKQFSLSLEIGQPSLR